MTCLHRARHPPRQWPQPAAASSVGEGDERIEDGDGTRSRLARKSSKRVQGNYLDACKEMTWMRVQENDLDMVQEGVIKGRSYREPLQNIGDV